MSDQGISDDGQDLAEQFDEDVVGANTVGTEDAPIDFPPDRPMGLPFADADVTDESLADRVAREEPEVWERDAMGGGAELGSDGELAAADERLEQIVELGVTDSDGDYTED